MSNPIRSVADLDARLAAIEDAAVNEPRFPSSPARDLAAATRMAVAYELRQDIAAWLAEVREDDERDAAIERLEEAHRV